MKDISVGSLTGNVRHPGSLNPVPTQPDHENTFGNMLRGAVNKVEHDNNLANRSIEELALNGGQEIHRTMIEIEKAEISFKLLMQVRNKIVSAYETIMRMPV